MDAQQLTDALAQPPGTAAALLPAAITAYFSNRWPRRESPEEADRVLRHLTGGKTWSHEVVAQKQVAMAFDRILALGFADAAWTDVEAFIELNTIPTARILHARQGRDSVEALLALAKRTTVTRVKNASLAAAIVASSRPVPAGLEDELSLLDVGWAPLVQAAFAALGSPRASAVALRSLRTYEVSSEYAFQSLAPVVDCFSPTYDDTVLEELAVRFGANVNIANWEDLGERLARAGEHAAALAFLQKYESRHPGWKWATRSLLALLVRMGKPLPAELDRYADPTDAAQRGYDTWRRTNVLLEAMGGERAEAVLRDATFAQPSDLLRFVARGFTPSTLQRFAEVHVAARDDANAKNLLIATRLQELGPSFGAALQAALADVKPKKGYVNALERNLEPAVFAELSKWLAERPEPKKKKAAKKT
jgi:hypothetical protein